MLVQSINARGYCPLVVLEELTWPHQVLDQASTKRTLLALCWRWGALCLRPLLVALQCALRLVSGWIKLPPPTNNSVPLGVASDLARSRTELLLENALLRQQLIVLQRQSKRPQTVLKWHRALVRRKRTFAQQQAGGRPASYPEGLTLLLRLAQAHPTWRYAKLHGELLKLGHRRGRSTVSDMRTRPRIPPAAERAKRGSRWRILLSRYTHQLLAGDGFSVETAWVQTPYGFFVSEWGRRRVPCAGCTAHPTADGVTQQARQRIGTWQAEQQATRFLIRDREAQFTASVDQVCVAEGSELIQTPDRAPRADACAARWIRGAGEECLDRMWVFGDGHRRCGMRE